MEVSRNRTQQMLALLFFLCLVCETAIGQTNGRRQGGKMMSDTMFVQKNMKDNMMEIRLSKLALEKSTDQQVKSEAQQMVTDHSAILQDLQSLATQMNLPQMDTANMDMMSSDSMHGNAQGDTSLSNPGASTQGRNGGHHGMGQMHNMQALQNASGKEFDQMWVSQMLSMHERKLNELTMASNKVQNAELKAGISRAIPKIKAHRDALSKMNTGGSGSGQTTTNK